MMNFSKDYDVDNDPIFQRFARLKESKGLSEHTIRSYHNSLDKLCKGNNESLTNIVKNCKSNQKSRVEADNTITEFSPNALDSAINIYIDGYIDFCRENGNKNTTINKGMASIRSFLAFYDVKLPKWEQFKNDADEWYLLTKEDIRYVLNSCNIAYTSLTTFLASTGMRVEDVCSLTIGDFMKATKEYHDFTDVEEFIDKAPQDMMGYWNFHPRKTQRFGIICKTFNSPESSNYILQSLRRIKNDYIPKKNLKSGLNIKLDNKSPLFGSRHKCFLKPLQEKSVTRFYTEKNKDLYQWNVDMIDQKLTKGELTGDRDEYIKKIPKLHPHAFRKFFIDTIRKKGDIGVCVTLEGHKPIISTDRNYVKPTKDIVKEVYIKALPNLSIAPIEARIITDSEAEELREEVKSLNRKLEEKDKEIEVLEISNEELRKQTLAQETRQQEIEERLANVENSFPELHNTLTEHFPDKVQNMELKAILMDLIDKYKEEDSPKVIAKKIKTFENDDLLALKEITCDLTKGVEKQPQTVEELDSLIAKAVLLMEIKPELKDKIIQDHENNSEEKPLTKFYEILKQKLESMELGEEKVVEKLCEEIISNFLPIFLESPMVEVTEELVMKEIEKYLFKNMA